MDNTEITTTPQTPVKTSRLLFITCFLVYACAYIARVNYSTAISGLTAAGLLAQQTAGLISSVYFICYALGQLCFGMLADRKSPYALVMTGVLVIVAANACMFLFPSPSFLLVVFWGINGIGQSMLWAPIFFILSNVLNEKIKYFAITFFTLSTPLGKISGYFLSGLSLRLGGWRGVFIMGSIVMALMSVLWITSVLTTKNKLLVRVPQKLTENNGKRPNVFNLLTLSGLIIGMPALIVNGLFLNGVAEWIPSLLKSNYGLSESAASYLTMIVPAVGVVGVFFCNLVYRKFKRNDMSAGAFIMGLNVIPVLVIFALTFSGGIFSLNGDAVVFVIAYGVITILQLAMSHLLISLVPLRFSGFMLAATVSGLSNAIHYGGSAISTYCMGVAFESMPLYGVSLIWLGCIAFATLALSLASIKWKKFIKDKQ